MYGNHICVGRSFSAIFYLIFFGADVIRNIYFCGKGLSKDKPTCKSAVARIYGSWKLRVMGSCTTTTTTTTIIIIIIIIINFHHLCAEKQTLTSLFVTCPNAHMFWSRYTDWWNRKNNVANNSHVITDTFHRGLIFALLQKMRKIIFRTPLAILSNKLQIENSIAKL